MKRRLRNLDDVISLQASHGNWNFDPYMYGLANGLILARSIMTNTEPEFLVLPKKWLKDKKSKSLPVAVKGAKQ